MGIAKIEGTMNRWIASCLLTGLAIAAGISLPAQNASPPAAARVVIPGRGAESKRWEPWSAMRTAAALVLGWKVGVAGDSFNQLSFSEAVEKADALSVGDIEGWSTEKVSEEVPKLLGPGLQPGEMRAVRDKLNAVNMRLSAYHVPSVGSDEASMRRLFEFARAVSVETIVSDRLPEALPLLDQLAGEFGVNVALCGNPQSVLTAVSALSKRVGVCLDTDSVNALAQVPGVLSQIDDRTLIVNLRSVSSPGKLSAFLATMYRLEIKPSLITVGATGAAATLAGLERSFDDFEKALQPVMAEKVDAISRTAAIRGPDRLTPEERDRIEAALPKEAPAKPRKSRKLLVLDLNVAYGGHRSIPAENFALQQMGKETGAYEAVFSNDLDNLTYPKIKQFDAVYLNNTVGMIFVDPAVRNGLVRFVREGGGLGGNHGTSHASMDWPEFHEMIGVRRGVHRASTEKVWIKIDDPHSPLTAAFDGKEIFYEDEYFRFPNPPYSRDKLHVLLSIDVAKTDMNQGDVFVPGSNVSRPDADYAVSWIRDYGKGHVFFCILGHNPTLFTTPVLAKYFLAGIQFMLGDLKADAMPSAKLALQRGT